MSSFTDKLKQNTKAYKTARQAESGLPNIADGTYVADCTPSCGVYKNGAPFIAFDFIIVEGEYEGLQLKGMNGVSHYLDPKSPWFAESLGRAIGDLKLLVPDKAEEIASSEIEDLEDIILDAQATKPVVKISVEKKKKKKAPFDSFLAIRILELADEAGTTDDDVDDETDDDEAGNDEANDDNAVDDDDLVPEVGDKVKYTPKGGRPGAYVVAEVDMDTTTVVLSNGKKKIAGVDWLDFQYE